MFKRFKRIKKNNRGETASLFVIIMMMCIYLYAFAVDIMEISWQRYTLVRHTNYVARVAGRQGGFLNSNPSGRWDKNVPYITRSQMYNNSAKVFSNANIDEWDIKFKKSRNSSNSKNLHTNTQYDFGEDFVVEGSIIYKWNYMDKVLPGNAGDKQYKVFKKVVSERFIRSNSDIEY